MYNKKVLIDSLKNLGSAKAPTKQKDKIYTNNDTLSPFVSSEGYKQGPPPPGTNYRIPGDTLYNPTPYSIDAVSDNGIRKTLKPYDTRNIYFPGATHVDEFQRYPVNKSFAEGKDVEKEFISSKNGGETRRVKLPNKKNSKGYSRSLEATNKFFTENRFFAKPKSRKNKVYDPNSQYYQNGGEPCPKGEYWNGTNCVPGINPESDWFKLTDAQKRLLEKGNNLATIEDWYKQSPEQMEMFKSWIDDHDAETYLNQLDPNNDQSKKFNEALDNDRQWNQEWYTKRKTLPQFKDVAERRLAINNQDIISSLKDPINLSMDWWKGHPSKYSNVPEVFYAPEIGAITRKNIANYNTDPKGYVEKSYYTDANGRLQNSTITHEETHIRDYLAPQKNTTHTIKKSEWNQPLIIDPLQKIITAEEALSDPRNNGYEGTYQQQPTEFRARLNVWRKKNGIDPLKNYTEEELKSIIDTNLQDPNLDSQIKELYETIKNDPSKLKFVHDSYVSNDSNKDLDKAEYGGNVITNHFQDGGNYFSYEGRPDAKYMKKNDGWYINAPGTNDQYIKVEDPTGSRTKLLNKQAVYHSGTKAKPASSSIMGNVTDAFQNVINPINSDILKVGESISGGGYNKAFTGSGTPFVISHNGQEILPAATDGTYCSGYTCGVSMKVLQQRGLLDTMTPSQLKNFQKTWYGAKDFEKGKSETLSTKALEDYNLGKRIEHKEAKSGDIAQIWRNNGSGHSVIFKDWVTDDKGNRIGIKYRSSQANTKGVGDRTEMFDNNIDPDRIYVARLNNRSEGGNVTTGHFQRGGATSPEAWGQEIKDVESQIGNPSDWTMNDYYSLQDKLNAYRDWRENTSEGQTVIDSHNEEGEYDIPLPEHLQDYTNGMMKSKLAYANEFGNPAAKRMITLPDNPYQFDSGDTGTHYMASMDNYAVPQIQDENGELMLGDYGPDSNEAIRFDSDEDARYFAEHYKDVSPGFVNAELTQNQIQEYAKGGFIIEDISVPSVGNYKKGGALLTKKVTCKKCGWKWDAADGGDDLTTCHKCGGQGLVHAQLGGLAKYIPKTANLLSKGLSAPNLLTNYLTTQTALANAYKMNPFARTLQEKNFIDKISFQSLFDDRNYYQMLNNASYKDLLNSNLLQSNFMTRETANKAYEMPYLAEVNADLTPEGIPFNQMFQNIKSGVYDNLTEAERSKLNFAPIEGEFITAKDPRVKIYKKHWLKGYTPVNDFQKSAEDLMTQTFSKRAVPIREYPKDEAGYVIKNLEPKINVYEWNAPNKVIPGRSEEDVSHKISNLKKDLDIGFVGNVASTFFPSLAPQISLAKDHSMLVSPEGRLWDSNTRYWLARKYGQEPNINQVLPSEKYARDYGNLIYSTNDKSFDDSKKLLDYKTYFSNPWKKEKDGGSMDYELGDEIDEATMEKLKKLGYTFEMVK